MGQKVDSLVVPGSRFNFPISWPSENNSALFKTAAQDKAKRREKNTWLRKLLFPCFFHFQSQLTTMEMMMIILIILIEVASVINVS